MDANHDVYTGCLAKSLQEHPYNMHCLLKEAVQFPNTHFSGSQQISTFFGTLWIVTGHGMCYTYWFGIGDHRVMVLEISTKAPCNGHYPAISSPSARSLNWKISCVRQCYCDQQEQPVQSHKMRECLKQIHALQGKAYTQAHNKWDSELGEFMKCAEQDSTGYKNGKVDFSPAVRRSNLFWNWYWDGMRGRF